LISRPRVFSGLPSAGARAMDHIFFHSRRLASMMNRSININNTQKKNTNSIRREFSREKKISIGKLRPGDTTGKRRNEKQRRRRRRRIRIGNRPPTMEGREMKRTGGVKSRRQQVLVGGFLDAVSHLLDPGLIVDHGSSRARGDRDLSAGRRFLGREHFAGNNFALAGERRRRHGQNRRSHFYYTCDVCE